MTTSPDLPSIMIMAVHLAPAISLPVSCGLVIWGAWYWGRMGRGSVPAIRRRLRRVGLLLGAVGLVLMVLASSFIDPATRPAAYLVAWMGVLVVVLLAVVVAVMDALATVRLHRNWMDRQQVRDALRLRGALGSEGMDPKPDRSPRSDD